MASTRKILPYGRQDIDEEDIAAVAAALRGDFLTTGPTVAAFEKALAESVGAPYAVACANGTAALHLAALALDIGPGDHVVVPAVTFMATANAVRYAGGEVIFADVDPETGLMRAEDLRAALDRARGRKVKAAFPVCLAGQCGEMAALAALAEARGLVLVHDACHALGTRYRASGREYRVGDGRHGALYAFSFHPVKTIAMGEGGALTTDDEALYQRLLRLRSHGISRDPESFENAELAFDLNGEPNPWYHEMQELGFNYRAPDILCALGLSQLGKLPRFAAKRQELAAHYESLLAPLAPLIRPIARTPDCRPVWHLFAVLIDFAALGLPRAQVMRELQMRGIGTQVHYIPVPWQPYYRARYAETDFPGARAYYERTLSLPLHTKMTLKDVEKVVAALTSIVPTITKG